MAGIDPLHRLAVRPKTCQIYVKWLRAVETDHPDSANAGAATIDADPTKPLLKPFAGKARAQTARYVSHAVKGKHALTNSQVFKAHLRLRGSSRKQRNRVQYPVPRTALHLMPSLHTDSTVANHAKPTLDGAVFLLAFDICGQPMNTAIARCNELQALLPHIYG